MSTPSRHLEPPSSWDSDSTIVRQLPNKQVCTSEFERLGAISSDGPVQTPLSQLAQLIDVQDPLAVDSHSELPDSGPHFDSLRTAASSLWLSP